jgi:hypothetical protein
MDREAIRLLLERINEAWLMYYPDQLPKVLADCFDENMVVKGPGFQAAGVGKDACIQGYADFLRQCAIRGCTLSTPDIDICGDTAVATYAWKMTYERNGKEHTESGHDVFVFSRSGDKWRAVWRAMLPD